MYKIISVEVKGDTLNTEVEYDGIGKVVVSHFMPESKEAVLANIEARGASELLKKTATTRNEAIKAELEAK